MENQLRKLGFALDWSKKKFTLDEDTMIIVYKTFKKMFDEGLIYRDNRLVNYCTHCGTSFSDLEVNHVERVDPLYYMKYGPFTLATVRPETKFGDTAVVVNPKDKRYAQWIGKDVEVEGLNGAFKLKVIADDVVDPEFGTGVMKVTPAHDFNDFEIAKRHNLEFKQTINFEGRLTAVAGKYEGLKVAKARELVVADLTKRGLMAKVDNDYIHVVSTCYKCARTLEPMLMPQWFVKVKPLTENAVKAIKSKKISFTPKRFEKIAIDWLTNFHDWNISRQIVWGIRIPAYRCMKDEEWFVSVEKPKKCEICGDCDFEQDTDTFDTWFSSGQWPFATLMSCSSEKLKVQSEKLDDNSFFNYFYPTSVMETGYDILPWWVCRMIMLGLYATEKVPFKEVYLHGLVRDSKGQKMSKSKGNVVNPLTMVDKYGADALRASLIFEVGAGVDQRFSEDKVRGMRNFANKIWNIGRFVYTNLPQVQSSKFKVQNDNSKQKETMDELTNEFQKIEKEYHLQMEKHQYSQAFGLTYEFVWHRLADHYIEKLKEEVKNGNISVLKVLEEVLLKSLVLLHPFVPFVTDSVHHKFKNKYILEN